jgi:polar amino acid transport system substrate-binding protein
MKKTLLTVLSTLALALSSTGTVKAAFPIYGPVDPDPTPIVTVAEQDNTAPLKVVTRVVQPFVVDKSDDPDHLCADSPMMTGQNNKQFCGYSQELLQILSQKLKREVAPQALDQTADQVVSDLSKSSPKYDMAIGNMSITSAREEVIDFSVPIPITNSGIQIMTRSTGNQKVNLWHNARSALTSQSAQQIYPIIGLILLLMLATATVVYFVEHRHKKSFLEGEGLLKGIAEAFWWILTTIFGQEEAHPRALVSRVIAFMWIPFGVICVSLFTAAVTASLTAQQIQNTIQGVDDLRDKKVLTVTGSTSKHYLDDHDIKAEVVKTINDAYPLLEKGDYDAIVYDAPALQYYADHEGRNKVTTVGKLLKHESYGLAFPTGSPLREQVNQALLQMQDEGTMDRLNQKWFEEK